MGKSIFPQFCGLFPTMSFFYVLSVVVCSVGVGSLQLQRLSTGLVQQARLALL